MKIGILQTGHAPDALLPESGDYDTMFARLLGQRGFDFETFAVVDGVFPENAAACDGWLITGSRHGAYEDHGWIAPLEALIREIATSGRPLIGVCFGHQIIAQALGGKVEKFAGGWAIGPQDYEIAGQHMVLNAYHQDQVTKLPPGAQVIGRNEFCANAALLIGDNILTIQPHPEFSADFIAGLIEKRGRGTVPDALLDAAEARLSEPNDNAGFAARMAGFFTRQTTDVPA
ncbi:type 1 glutamine amidotransferase [Aquicoccus sp. G2-2]|uniref:type 1 glutamine amidotransferase n=1 Tax=Aquicoccus sp. G2-2 TaxID=3092120 RepID=UPI002ADF04E8|nr:type 1 glutamine amidotransferase [Aquicoccus sp. G2-2]MEA1112857.1 type 1 glutamine amidotransferase [Aquicoccus sp. G2-2]